MGSNVLDQSSLVLLAMEDQGSCISLVCLETEDQGSCISLVRLETEDQGSCISLVRPEKFGQSLVFGLVILIQSMIVRRPLLTDGNEKYYFSHLHFLFIIIKYTIEKYSLQGK